jgi:hypothetical protein
LGIRVPTMVAGEACRWWISGEHRWLLGTGEATTAFRTTRRPRERDRCPRFRPDEGEGGDWSGAGQQVLWTMDDGIDLWQIVPSQVVSESRR